MSSSIANIATQLIAHKNRDVALASALVIIDNTKQSPPTPPVNDHTVGAPLTWIEPGQMVTRQGHFQGYGTVGEGVAPLYKVLVADSGGGEA